MNTRGSVVDVFESWKTGTTCATTDARLDHLRTVVVRITSNLAADPSTLTVNPAARRDSISGRARALTGRVADGRQDGGTVGVGLAPIADRSSPTGVTGSSIGWSVADPTRAAADKWIAETVRDNVEAVWVVTTRPWVGQTLSTYTGDVLVVRSVAGQTPAATVLTADGVVKQRRTLVGMLLTDRVVVVVESSASTTSAIVCRLVPGSTRACAVDAVASGERVAAVQRHVTVGPDAPTYADRRRRLGVDRVETGNAFAPAVGAALAAGNRACAVGSLSTEAADWS